MKINRKYTIAVFLLISLFSGIVLAGCDQEALFWVIAHELPPIGPVIEGHPSQIVKLDDRLYVSNSIAVWQWALGSEPTDSVTTTPNWSKMNRQPSGRIRDLAVAGTTLFALADNGTVHAWDGTSWSEIAGPGTVQRIFGAGDFLFAGTLNNYTYSIFSMNAGSDTLIVRESNTGFLRGAAYNGTTYVLGTQGGGVYTSPDGIAIDPVSGYGNIIMGLTEFDGEIYIVSNSQLYQWGVNPTAIGPSYRFTGAIRVWENRNGELLLLLGIQLSSGSFAYGYRELRLPTGSSNDFNMPGLDSPTSMELDSGRTSAIRNNAVNHLFVMPRFYSSGDDSHRPLIFASTQRNGLWSYRVRNGTAQWNGENNR